MNLEYLTEEEHKRVMRKLKELLPKRKIILLDAHWGNFEGEEVNRNESDYNICIESRLSFNLYDLREKLRNREITLTQREKEQKSQEIAEEHQQIISAFKDTGIRKDLNFETTTKYKGSEYWRSDKIVKRGYLLKTIKNYNQFMDELAQSGLKSVKAREDEKEIFFHPGIYEFTREGDIDIRSQNRNHAFLRVTINPKELRGLYNNCTICRGTKYEGKNAVTFLVVDNSSVNSKKPLACEYCIDDYFAQVVQAFKQK